MEFHFSKKIELVEYAMPFNMSFAKLYILNSEHIGIVNGFGFSNEMEKICDYLTIASLLYILYCRRSIRHFLPTHFLVKIDLHGLLSDYFPGKVLKDAMWSDTRAATKNSFDFRMNELKKLDVKAYKWLVKLDVRTWSRYAFDPRSKSDTLVNIIAKFFNAWILEARDKPVLTMMEIIRVMLMQRLQTKRDHMRRYEERVCPRIHKKLERIKSKVVHCISHWNGESKYEVEYIYWLRYGVDLNERTCEGSPNHKSTYYPIQSRN